MFRMCGIEAGALGGAWHHDECDHGCVAPRRMLRRVSASGDRPRGTLWAVGVDCEYCAGLSVCFACAASRLGRLGVHGTTTTNDQGCMAPRRLRWLLRRVSGSGDRPCGTRLAGGIGCECCAGLSVCFECDESGVREFRVPGTALWGGQRGRGTAPCTTVPCTRTGHLRERA